MQKQESLRHRLAENATILNNFAHLESDDNSAYFDIMDRQQVEEAIRDVLDETDAGTVTSINCRMYHLSFDDPSPVIERVQDAARAQTGGKENFRVLSDALVEVGVIIEKGDD